MDASLTGNQSSQISKKNHATIMIAVLECHEACRQAALDAEFLPSAVQKCSGVVLKTKHKTGLTSNFKGGLRQWKQSMVPVALLESQ